MGDAHFRGSAIDHDQHLRPALQTTDSHKNRALPEPKDPGLLEQSLVSDQFNPLKVVNDFVSQNSNLFTSRSGDDGDTLKDIEDSVNGFQDTAKIIVKGLHALGQIHPFVGIATTAFALVITMDLSRRDNDRKVLAVKVQMQELMIVFFELRHVRGEVAGDDDTSIASRLGNFMLQVATDIKQCGSACDAYLKKSFLARTVKASVYENRLAGFAQKFVAHKSALMLSLSLHTTIGVDATNAMLHHHGEMLESISKSLDMNIIFRKLDTPRERDVQKHIEEHGGIQACLMNEEYLGELIDKSGESVSRISDRSGGTGRRSNDLLKIRERLLKEMKEDVDETFARNWLLFERKLDMQQTQLSDMMRQQSNHLITALTAGAHDRINDPDLRQLWKDMGWKGRVKARTFVLNLHDYYADQRNLIDQKFLPSPMLARSSQSKDWALEYINAAYVQSILEAVDDDGTGFISIKGLNAFVEKCPAGWSLPEWFAFWAAGWQISIMQYKSKVYGLIRSMFEMLDFILPSNRRGADNYLFDPPFWRIELLLRSTTPVNLVTLNQDLMRYTEMYTTAEEKRLETNLEKVRYELDTTATVSLVTGEGRIEQFVYPLIYLLLKRHLQVLRLAYRHVLDAEEFLSLSESLYSVLLAIDARIVSIEAVFKQTHFDIKPRLGNFACGLFQLSYGDIRRNPAKSTFATWNNEEESGIYIPHEIITKDTIEDALTGISHDILKYGYRDGFQSTDYFEFEPHRRQYLGCAHPLEGTWTGHNQLPGRTSTVTFVLRISILVSEGKDISGKGETFIDAFKFSGSDLRPNPGGLGQYEFSFDVKDDEDRVQRSFHGKLDAMTGVITARWTDRWGVADPESVMYQEFSLTQTPPSLIRYRYTDDALTEDAARARWSFASAAVRHMVQQRLWSRTFLEERATERKRYVELSTRSLVVNMEFTPQKPLSIEEKGELDSLRRNLNPSEARFYQALADFEVQKLPWHSAWYCDGCERTITKARYLCITCMSDDLSENIDLCLTCADRTPTREGFVHDVSHTVVKVEQTLHDFQLPRVVANARNTIERMKNQFRALEANVTRPDEDTDVEAPHKVSCACCAENVMPPCWACVMCKNETFVCNACDAKRLPTLPSGPSPSHSLSHPLARIRDTSHSKQSLTTEEQPNALEQRLIMVEHKISDDFAATEARSESRMTKLESQMEERLNKLESQMEERLNKLEAQMGERLNKLETQMEERLNKLEAYTEKRFDTLEVVLRQAMAQAGRLSTE